MQHSDQQGRMRYKRRPAHLDDTADNVTENSKRERKELEQRDGREDLLCCQWRFTGEGEGAERRKGDQEGG